MIKRILLIVCIGWQALTQAQPINTPKADSNIVKYPDIAGKQLLDAIIVDGDTIPILALDEVLFIDEPTFDSKEAKRRYFILRRKVLKVYPYAVIAGNKLDSLNLELVDIRSKWKRKRRIKKFQKYLEEKFESKLRKMTHTEGQILSKLIYRETGITSYELISTYRSGWNAFWWNVVANYNEISLKTPYDPENVEEDKLIENILKRAFINGSLKERVPITDLKPNDVH